jgi:U6 snRNA-associated Sm-like protein LSm1
LGRIVSSFVTHNTEFHIKFADSIAFVLSCFIAPRKFQTIVMYSKKIEQHNKQTFRSFDQFSNMVLDDACERKIHVDMKDGITYYADIPLGLYIVRGDSVVLLGQIGDDDDGALNGDVSDKIKSLMKMIDIDELEEKIASAASSAEHQEQSSSPPLQGEGHVLEWDFDKDLLA